MAEVKRIIVLIMLAVFSFHDINERKISIRAIFTMAVIGNIINIYMGIVFSKDIILGELIGIIIFVLSYISKGKFGAGDGLVLMVTGVFLGFSDNLKLILLSIFISGIVSAFLILFRMVKKSYELPFVLFILIGYLGVVI